MTPSQEKLAQETVAPWSDRLDRGLTAGDLKNLAVVVVFHETRAKAFWEQASSSHDAVNDEGAPISLDWIHEQANQAELSDEIARRLRNVVHNYHVRTNRGDYP